MALWNIRKGGNDGQRWDNKEGSLEEMELNLCLEGCGWDECMGKNDWVKGTRVSKHMKTYIC